MKIILHGLHLTQKACSYYLCKQLINTDYTKCKLKKTKTKNKATLKLWSSIFGSVFFKHGLIISIEEHKCEFLICFAHVSLLIF